MTDRKYPVRIAIETVVQNYSVDFQTQGDFSAQWKAVLQRAHKRAVVTCLCSGSGSRRLTVRHRTSGDTFHLSRYPFTGAEHSLDCLYFSPDPEKSGLGAYSKGVVEETAAGDLKIKLSLSLRKKEPAEAKPQCAPTSSAAGKQTKPAMTLLGLLHLLWSEAGLNAWVPAMAGKRNLGLIHYKLIEAAAKVTTARMRLEEALVVATSSSSGRQVESNISKVESSIKNHRRILVVAPLAAHSGEREECAARYLTIAGFHGVPRLLVNEGLWESTKRRFKREISAWRQGKRIIAIVQADQPTSIAKAEALNIALMVVSSEWIPVDSSLEAIVEAKLREEGRRFVKPLRFDSAEDVVFPDFWLMDVSKDREYPMEVYGRLDAKYLARKLVKTEHYKAEYGASGWWAWDAARDPECLNMPEFPPARAR